MNDTRQVRANTGNRIALGVLVLLVSLFVFVCDCGAFGGVGDMVSSVFVGFFGLADYAYSLIGVLVGIFIVFNVRVRMIPSKIVKVSLLLVFGIWALHIYSSSGHLPGNDYGAYLLACYNGANTAGGMLYGIISYPLMKLITTVGALVVVCAVFFVMGFIACIPTIKKDVTYTTVTRSKFGGKYDSGAKVRGSRMDKQKEPSITDFGGDKGGNALYVVDVDGDPMSKSKRKAKGASGYDPLYPNAGAHFEDEQVARNEKSKPDKFSSRSLARDILFSPNPEEDSLDKYNMLTNPDEALSNPGASFGAVRRNELRRKLGVDNSDAMARDMVRERYFGDAPSDGDKKNSSNIVNPDARGASALGYTSFDALKADRTKLFGEMFSGKEDKSAASESANASGFGYSSSGNRDIDQPVRREVPKPSRTMKPPADNRTATATPPTTSAANMAGLHGSVSRAISGEERTQAPQGKVIPEATAYEKAGVPPTAAKADAFNSAVRAAQAAVNNQQDTSRTVFGAGRQTDAGAAAREQRRVPRAFEGTAIDKQSNVAEQSARGNTYTPADRVNDNAQPSSGFNAFSASFGTTPETRPSAQPAQSVQTPQQTARPQQARPQTSAAQPAQQQRATSDARPSYAATPSDNVFSTSANANSTPHTEAQRKVQDAIEKGVPRREDNPAFDGNSGTVIQQSMFAKQQMENIAKARKEAPPLASYEHIAEERSKRIYAPRDKSLQKAENLVKKMENEAGKQRMTQVNMEQAISKATPRKPYIAPPMKLLIPPEPAVSQDEDYEYKKRVLVETLNFFDVNAEVVEIKVGPTFSLYTLHVEMPKGRTIGSLVSLENDIAMKMEEESVRILAPIPGKNAVGIEVPNKKRRIVRLSEILQSAKFNQSKSPVTFALGKDLFGAEYVCDIKELPHMLIAGATGAGKSCCINSLIISLLYKASPEDVRLIMVDPKRVELSVYSGIPHLMLDEIICDVDKAIRALNWAIGEMQRRIEYLSGLKYRDIDEYNQNCEREGYEKMPRIVVIVDELADLMAQGKKAVEDAINRIARLARAVGIHLILATQRPSVDVVSGTIKNNLPSRVAFKVTAGPDSRTILDAGGAEKLLGNGDLFYMTPKIANPIRMQGAFISNSEVKDIVDFIKEHNDSYYDERVKDAIFKEKEEEPADSGKSGGGKAKPDKDAIPPEVFEAVRMGLDGNLITISSMQRRLGLGFPKAAKIFDIMKDMNLIEPDPESKKHKVCITEEDLEELMRANSSDEDGEE